MTGTVFSAEKTTNEMKNYSLQEVKEKEVINKLSKFAYLHINLHFAALRMEPRASSILSKCSIIELHPTPY